MRYLWVCNIELPIVSDFLKNKRVPIGGWLDNFSRKLISNKKDSFMAVYPNTQEKKGKNENLIFSSFNYKTDLFVYFSKILNEFKPDIIHLWGTEFKFTSTFTMAIKKANLIDKTVISIQGLVSAYSKHYFAHLPIKVLKPYSFKDFVKSKSIIAEKKAFEERGLFELEALKNVKHVIGRTDWDKALSMKINPLLNYHFCNEIMRERFYLNKWSFSEVDKGSIFVSQNSYPIKGFHILIEALIIIKNIIPSASIKTTGYNFLKNPFYRLTSYQKYLKELIVSNNLESSIQFLGELDEIQMINNLKKSNAFVLPSVVENSSNSLAEAMLLGLPIVASFVGGISNFITHGKDGFLYPADEPALLAYYLIMIIQNTQNFLYLSNNVREKAITIFNPDKNFQDLKNIYESIQ